MTHNHVTPARDFLPNHIPQPYQSPPEYHAVHPPTHRYVHIISNVIHCTDNTYKLYFNFLVFYIFVFADSSGRAV